MVLIRKLPKRDKRSSRYRSTAHCNHVRGHACVKCGCDVRGMIEVAHVRIGSGAGMSQKPHDWRAVPLCKSCHRTGEFAQHIIGERSFWREIDVEGVIRQLISTSPKRREIDDFMKEMDDGKKP